MAKYDSPTLGPNVDGKRDLGGDRDIDPNIPFEEYVKDDIESILREAVESTMKGYNRESILYLIYRGLNGDSIREAVLEEFRLFLEDLAKGA